MLPALRMLAAITVLCGFAYPLAVLAVGQLAFAHAADGSLVESDSGAVVGSSLLGQQFSDPQYFWPRPSAAGPLASRTPGTEEAPVDPADLSLAYSGGSNLGPTSADLLDTVAERVVAYRHANGLAAGVAVPVDAVTASGSGVDPHISVANARLQAGRVAAERGLDVDEVLALVDDHTDGRVLGVFGEPGVNVLELNLALDEAEEG